MNAIYVDFRATHLRFEVRYHLNSPVLELSFQHPAVDILKTAIRHPLLGKQSQSLRAIYGIVNTSVITYNRCLPPSLPVLYGRFRLLDQCRYLLISYSSQR